MRINVASLGRAAVYVTVAALMMITVAACQPHRELKSNCHVAGHVPDTGCDWKPIGKARAS